MEAQVTSGPRALRRAASILPLALLALPTMVARAQALPEPDAAEEDRPTFRDRPTVGVATGIRAPDEWEATTEVTEADVVQSVARFYPLVLAAQARVAEAEGQALSARGIFDPVLRAGGRYQGGLYENGLFSTGLSATTNAMGLRLDAGWRLGTGEFEPYYGELPTQAGGELGADLVLPLWKDGLTDKARTEVVVRGAKVLETAGKADLKLVEASRDGRVAWWEWVAARYVLALAEELLRVAQVTRQAIEGRVAAGDLPEIDLIDNERVVVERQLEVQKALATEEAAAWKLGLFLRDADGQPLRPPRDAIPAFNTPGITDTATLDEDLAIALQVRPEIGILEARRQIAEAKLRLARVSTGPKIDLKAGFRYDLPGVDESAKAPDLKIGLDLGMPLLLREGRGALSAARADLDAISQEQRYLRDAIRAALAASRAKRDAAREALTLARRNVALARQLEEAVRTRYLVGDTDLFAVYLREQSTASAILKEIEALLLLHLAEADLRAALGKP